jgi:tRNA G10  N-methylase Trm11
MAHLTLQEVVDRINQIYFSVEKRHTQDDRADYRERDPKHRPEFYIPRITRRLARFILST